jgi:hypothetical protein
MKDFDSFTLLEGIEVFTNDYMTDNQDDKINKRHCLV